MVHGMKKHEYCKQLARGIVKLPEEPAVGNKGGDFLHIAEHVTHGAIIVGKDYSRGQAQAQG